jgi:hypothetical protein
MNNVSENELLSAYVDGELTADDRAQIERLLAASPEARRLVEELRAVRSTLGALPALKIGEDISEQVVRRAERQVLSEPGAARRQPETPDEGDVPLWRAVVRRVARPRNFVWSAVAVAVVVLLALTSPDTRMEPTERSVAVRAGSEADEAGGPGAAPSMQARGDFSQESLAETPAEAEMPVAEPAPRGPESVALKGGEPEPTSAAPGRDLARAKASAAGAQPALVAKGPAEGATRDRRAEGGMGGGYGSMGIAHDSAPDEGKADAPQVAKGGRFVGQPSVMAKKPKLPGLGPARKSVPDEDLNRSERVDEGPQALLVVSCDVTAEAQRRRVFEELLLRNSIAEAVVSDAGLGEAAGKPASTPARVAPTAQKAQQRQLLQIDVQATRGQVKGLLADVEQRPGEFQSLSYRVEPVGASGGGTPPGTTGKAAGQTEGVARSYERAQVAGAAAAPSQQQVSAEELDELLDLVPRYQWADRARRRLESAAAADTQRELADHASEAEGRSADRISQPGAGQTEQRLQFKAGKPVRGADVRGGRPGRADQYAYGMQRPSPTEPAPPAEAPAQAPAEPRPAKPAEAPARQEAKASVAADALRVAGEEVEEDEAPMPPFEQPGPPKGEEVAGEREAKGPTERPTERAAEKAEALAAQDSEEAKPARRSAPELGRQMRSWHMEDRSAAEAQQALEREPAEPQRRVPPPETDQPEEDARYWVRFVLRVIQPDGAGVAASVQEPAGAARMGVEASEVDIEPSESPAAEAAPKSEP